MQGSIAIEFFGYYIFANILHMFSEGNYFFYDVSTLDIEEIHIKFSASGKIVNISDAKRELKFKYQLLADVAVKGILAKAGSFVVLTLEKFKMMNAIVKVI